MFLDEARLIATLHHPHVAQVFEVGCTDDGSYFLAMEYVHGETAQHVLETSLGRDYKLPLDFGLAVTCAAAAGLHHAHERRTIDGTPLDIVHRDVSPSNLIVSFDGSVKLIDFGIAKAHARGTRTRTGFIKGKAGYMAPEQARGFEVDRRSDVFALGVLAYELTTQRRAFKADNEFETIFRVVHGDLVRPTELVPGYPPVLEDLILTALEVDPDDRFQDADEMRRALEQVGGALGPAAVTRVLHDLYGARVEPWLARPAVLARGTVDVPTPVDEPDTRRYVRPESEDLPDEPEIVHADERAELDAVVPTRPVPRASRSVEFLRPPAAPLRATADRSPHEALGYPERSLRSPAAPLRATADRSPHEALGYPERSLRSPAPAVLRIVRPRQWRASAFVIAGLVVAAIAGSIVLVIGDAGTAPASVPVGKPAGATAVHATGPVTVTAAAPIAVPAPAAVPATVAAPAPVPAAAPAAAQPDPDTVMLTVTSDPPGATVVLDGVRLGTAPYRAPISLAHKLGWLKVRMVGRIPIKKQVSLDHDVEWTIALPPR